MTGIIIPDGGTIGSASDTDAISIASDGKATLSQKPTFSQGIANTGTIDAGTFNGTIGTSATHTVGWQHIQTFHHTSSSSDTSEIFFNNVFSNDYMMFCLSIGHLIPSDTPFDLNMRLTSGGNTPTDHSDSSWYGRIRHYTQGDSDYETTNINAFSYCPLVDNSGGNSASWAFAGEVYFYDVSSPTVLGVSTDRGNNYHPMVKSQIVHYHVQTGSRSAGYGDTMMSARWNTGHDENDYTGFRLFTNNNSNAPVNLMDGSHMSLFGLKVKATS